MPYIINPVALIGHAYSIGISTFPVTLFIYLIFKILPASVKPFSLVKISVRKSIFCISVCRRTHVLKWLLLLRLRIHVIIFWLFLLLFWLLLNSILLIILGTRILFLRIIWYKFAFYLNISSKFSFIKQIYSLLYLLIWNQKGSEWHISSSYHFIVSRIIEIHDFNLKCISLKFIPCKY